MFVYVCLIDFILIEMCLFSIISMGLGDYLSEKAGLYNFFFI